MWSSSHCLKILCAESLPPPSNPTTLTNDPLTVSIDLPFPECPVGMMEQAAFAHWLLSIHPTFPIENEAFLLTHDLPNGHRNLCREAEIRIC